MVQAPVTSHKNMCRVPDAAPSPVAPSKPDSLLREEFAVTSSVQKYPLLYVVSTA